MHVRLRIAFAAAASASLLAWTNPAAQQTGSPGVTFTRDIAPIFQRSCQECHHADGVAPMALVTYEDVRPWARSMKARTSLRWQRGAMPCRPTSGRVSTPLTNAMVLAKEALAMRGL